MSSSFPSLGVATWLTDQLSGLGVTSPTPVQTNCVPAILEGRDCVGIAKTGQGKTFAFAIPILQTLSEDPYGVYCLVLTPTRELALQIGDSFTALGKPMGSTWCWMKPTGSWKVSNWTICCPCLLATDALLDDLCRHANMTVSR